MAWCPRREGKKPRFIVATFQSGLSHLLQTQDLIFVGFGIRDEEASRRGPVPEEQKREKMDGGGSSTKGWKKDKNQRQKKNFGLGYDGPHTQ